MICVPQRAALFDQQVTIMFKMSKVVGNLFGYIMKFQYLKKYNSITGQGWSQLDIKVKS